MTKQDFTEGKTFKIDGDENHFYKFKKTDMIGSGELFVSLSSEFIDGRFYFVPYERITSWGFAFNVIELGSQELRACAFKKCALITETL